MGVEDVKEFLNEYFNYIRAVFLNEYSRYLSIDRINEIKSYSDVFKVDLENKFRIYCTEKININLNLKDFIKENNLNNDSELKDIAIEGRIFIKYLVDNQNNISEILMSQTINPIVSYLIKYPGFFPKALSDVITQKISKKYKLPYQMPFASKEAAILEKLILAVDEDSLYKAILKNNYDEFRILYNQISDYTTLDFDNLNKELNKEYNNYQKKIGRVYYTDSLYDYQNLNYVTSLESINKVVSNKMEQTNLQKERFISAYNALNVLAKHMIIYSNNEQLQIKNYIIEVRHIIEKLSKDFIHINYYYKKLLSLEEAAMHLTEKLWKSELTYPLNYIPKNPFCFLIGQPKKENLEYVEARLFTEKHLINMKKSIYNYGIIYGVENNSIIYASSKDVLVTPTKIDSQSINKIKVNDNVIEIDDQSDSSLIPPDLILSSNLRNNEFKGKVILNDKYTKKLAIFCVVEDDLDYSFEKAKELGEMYNLPLIKILKKDYVIETEQNIQNKVMVENTIEHKNPILLTDKVRKLKDKILYDENLEKVI